MGRILEMKVGESEKGWVRAGTGRKKDGREKYTYTNLISLIPCDPVQINMHRINMRR